MGIAPDSLAPVPAPYDSVVGRPACNEHIAMSDHSIKSYFHGTHRLVAPGKTISRAQSMMRIAGITRVADVTGLDSIGIPVVMVCRPNARSVSVAQGKGIDADAACASGLMESLEQWHAEQISRPLRFSTYSELSTRHRLVDCAGLPRLSIGSFHPDNRMLWIEGEDLIDGGPRLVPFETVHTDFTLPPPAGSGCFLTTSTGLASGNDRLEAILHGIYEVIERDAVTAWRAGGLARRRQTRVDLATVDDPVCQRLLARYSHAGIAVSVWDASSVVGLPVFVAEVVDRDPQSWRTVQLSGGQGCHRSRSIALARALTEAAQSRLTWISSARDDIDTASYERSRVFGVNTAWLAELNQGQSPDRSFSTAPDGFSERFDEDLNAIIGGLVKAGLNQVVVVDLTRPDIELPVVRVVIPGLDSMDDAPGYARRRRAPDARSS